MTTIQPFPTFSKLSLAALKALRKQIGDGASAGRSGLRDPRVAPAACQNGRAEHVVHPTPR